MAAREKLMEFSNLMIFGFCCGLRGEEIVKVGVTGFLKYLEVGAEHDECPHMVVPLLVRLKGEMGERYHMMILARDGEWNTTWHLGGQIGRVSKAKRGFEWVHVSDIQG
jgi:hypothetical protein